MKKDNRTKEKRQEARSQIVIKGLHAGRKIVKDSAEGWGMLLKESWKGYKMLGNHVKGLLEE